ncbi:MAG: adenylate/guanylate cyclase domain-containing protein [Sulfitobacter sp.]
MTSPEQNISDFLSGIGMDQLLGTFLAEDIDMPTLLLLDKDDLKELGLTLGQRKKLLLALDVLRSEPPKHADTQTVDEAPLQLRRISVLFCDIVGSTELSQQLSIEDMQTVLQHYYKIANTIVAQREGYLVGLQGDGVVILFGYPRVLDGFAERCVLAAQDLQNALAQNPVTFETRDPIYIDTRIGIATGQAAVGQADGNMPGDPMQLVGLVVNRAARLQTVARTHAIAVDEKTKQLTRESVQYTEAEAHQLKGLPEGTEVFHVVGLGQSTDGPASTGALIGRQYAINALTTLWTQAQAGTPGALCVIGDAGIGKTTLLQGFTASLATAVPRILHFNCTAMAARSPLHPVTKALERLTRKDPNAQTLTSLLGNPDPKLVQQTAQYLGLSKAQPGQATLSLSDRDQIMALLSDWMIPDTDTPTLIVIENAQWADESTRDLMRQTLAGARMTNAPLAMVVLTRDEHAAFWADDEGYTPLMLPPLTAACSETLLQQILGARPVPQSVRTSILANSGGNPLMLETLGQAQLQHQLTGDTGVVEIPHTIYESVSKRLDGIQLGRSVIEALAVLNSPASLDLLAAVQERDADGMAPAVEALIEAGLIVRETGPNGEVISFRHQVYRDVIYEQIVSQSRRKLHAAAYVALGQFDTDIESRRPDILATHAHVARDWAATSEHALNAGEKMLKRSALIEAGYFLEIANTAQQQLPDTDQINKKRLRTITGLASVERSRFGIATDASAELGQQAVDLARSTGDSQTELLALNGLYAHALVRADYPRAEEHAQILLDTARRSQNKTFTMIGTRAIGAVAFHRGDYDTALRNLGIALDQYDKQEHASLAHAHGYDHAEICAVFLSMSNWMQGNLVKAGEFAAFSIDHSREIDHAHSLAQAIAFRLMLGALAREGSEMTAIADEAIALGDKLDIRVMRAAAILFPYMTGLCLQKMPPTAEQMAKLDEHVNGFLAVNPFNYGPLLTSLLADVFLRVGNLDAADAALSDGARTEARTGETWTAPELIRMRARAADARGNGDTAQHLRKEALSKATQVGASTLALRISCDMAEANPCDNTRAQVREALSKVISDGQGWDVKRANTLL